jgi:CheY-like chemotaxis protein
VPWRVVKAERLLLKARLINVVGFALVLVAVLAVAIGIIWSRAADAWVAHTLEVQQKTQSFLISTTDAESTLRSFLTDVVLPGGVTGRVLADRVREKYPDLPVLYTTGYTRNAIVHQGRLDPDAPLLNKPYTQQDLAKKVRELLDAKAG